MKRTPLPRSTPLPRTPRKPSRTRDTGPSEAVVVQVALRDDWSCFRCGGSCHGRRGWDWSMQHRRARGMGSTRRPDVNEPQNLILLCGSATSPGGCHLWVETHRDEARGNGWLIWQSDDPLLIPVAHWERGLIFLHAGGGWGSRPVAL